jgi:hypothetical protein
MSQCERGFVFQHKDRTFVARIFRDEHYGAPWKEHDGHGPVREASSKDGKRPGERVLHSARWSHWLYDWQAACALAEKDGWGASNVDTAGLTPGQIRDIAVQQDFDRLKGWLKDYWWWVGIGVQLCAEDGSFDDDDDAFYKHAIWGVESDAGDYFMTLAREQAEEILK